MKHLGDISKINGAEIEPVDVITFGSPCQDLSVAGKRAGLEGARSGLFMEAVRIIKEMREATNGQYPTFALWENVPGAFSSNKGEDFRIVLEELIKIAEPCAAMPEVPPFGWAYADSYSGNGWSLAYRVFDAQYWGVPQRRRRIHLVADFRGQRAREILFERKGLRGHLTESPAPRERITVYVEDGPGASDIQGFDGYNSGLTGDKSSTLGVNCGMSTGRNGVVYAVATQQGGAEISDSGICPTVTAAAGMSGNNQPWVVYNGENITNPLNKANPQPGEPCHTLGRDSRNYLVQAYGISSYASNAMLSDNPHSGIYEAETSRTLDLNGGNPACNQGGVAIVQQTGIIDSVGDQAERGWEGDTVPVAIFENHSQDTRYKGPLDTAPTVSATYGAGGNNQPFVVEPITVHGEHISGTLLSRDYKGVGRWDSLDKVICCPDEESPVVFDKEVFNSGANASGGHYIAEGGPAPTLRTSVPPGVSYRYIVRRLTPTECARLQGFSDKWGHPDPKEDFTEAEYLFWLDVRNTHAGINGKTVKEYTKEQMLKWYNKLHSDSAEYKMWGNGIALPPALYCMQGISNALEKCTSIEG